MCGYVLKPLLVNNAGGESSTYLRPVRASLAGPWDDSGEGSGAVCQQVAWFVNSKKELKMCHSERSLAIQVKTKHSQETASSSQN